MAAPPAQPVDEIAFRKPDVIVWWLGGEHNLPGPWYPMEDRFIHRYFSETPFFDWSSKNGLMIDQARNNWDLHYTVHNRPMFEAALRKRSGLEYMVVETPQVPQVVLRVPGLGKDPQLLGPSQDGEKSGMWVLRKQERLNERVGNDAENPYPKTETRATYFIVGENVHQAPSVADVVGGKMLSAVTSLSKMFEGAARLPSFAPTTGHTYLPQNSKATNAGAASTQGSPNRSREGSVAPGGMDTRMDSQSVRSGSVVPPDSQIGGAATATSTSAADIQGARLLAQSFQSSIQFADEYMDENPIVGQPGSFKFTSSTAAVKKRKADEEAAASAAALAAQRAKEGVSRVQTPKPKAKAPTPPAVFTEAKVGAGARKDKETKEERKKRKRSRANIAGTTPTTPASANTLTGGAPG